MENVISAATAEEKKPVPPKPPHPLKVETVEKESFKTTKPSQSATYPKSDLARSAYALLGLCLLGDLKNECLEQSLSQCHQRIAFSKLSSKKTYCINSLSCLPGDSPVSLMDSLFKTIFWVKLSCRLYVLCLPGDLIVNMQSCLPRVTNEQPFQSHLSSTTLLTNTALPPPDTLSAGGTKWIHRGIYGITEKRPFQDHPLSTTVLTESSAFQETLTMNVMGNHPQCHWWTAFTRSPSELIYNIDLMSTISWEIPQCHWWTAFLRPLLRKAIKHTYLISSVSQSIYVSAYLPTYSLKCGATWLLGSCDTTGTDICIMWCQQHCQCPCFTP